MEKPNKLYSKKLNSRDQMYDPILFFWGKNLWPMFKVALIRFSFPSKPTMRITLKNNFTRMFYGMSHLQVATEFTHN